MKKSLYCCLLALFLQPSPVALAQLSFTQRVVKDNLFIPWELIYGPDDHLWFTQKDGYVCRLDPVSGELDTVYHEAQSVVIGEGGMLGMALHPNFGTDPYVFIAYEYNDGSLYKERVVKYRFTGGVLQTPQTLIEDIQGATIHNGCRLAIVGDKLFISTGDAANTALAQNVTSLNGKILRINLDGSIPVDNPIPGNAVWSWGHRNAQGLTEHNGILYSSEHGPNNDDELNIIKKGRNYGWPNVQGFCDQPGEIQYCADSNIVAPLYAWTPTLAVCGIEYYNHPMFPELANSILMTTLKDNSLYQLQLNAAGDSITGVIKFPDINYGRLRDIAVAPDGRIFISTSNSNASDNGPRVDQIIELFDPTATGISGLHTDNNTLLVYPNPAVDLMNIAFLEDGRDKQQWRYTVTDMQGQVTMEGRLEFNSLHIGSLYPGIYILKMWNEKNEMVYRRFVKW